MEYIKIVINGITHAFPEPTINNLIADVRLEAKEDGCYFFASYGVCKINKTIDEVMELIRIGSFEELIGLLIENGIDVQRLPIWLKINV